MLSWHKVGCYATAFATVPFSQNEPSSSKEGGGGDVDQESPVTMTDVGSKAALSTVQLRRDEKAQTTHWLAAGAKDGKVSLWDIY